MLLGGHVSIAKGIELAPKRGADIGATVIQMFASSPRSFKPTIYSKDQLAQCKRNANIFGIKRIYLHGVYLINLAAIDEDYRQTSIRSLLQYLEISDAISGHGVIFHPGFLQGAPPQEALERVTHCCKFIIEQMPKSQTLIIENSAGARGSLCSNLEDLAIINDRVGNNQLGFCLDTQHLFATGFDLRTAEGITTLIDQFDRLVGWEKVHGLHCNDSKTALGSHLDRHENIGQGKIGLEGFHLLVNHPKFRDLPFILEVPGIDGRSGPDKANVEVLQSLIEPANNGPVAA